VQDTELKYTQKEVSCFNVTTWSRLAEVCGESRSKVSIVAERVGFKPDFVSEISNEMGA
jgi:hypothetical protein